MTSSGSDNWPRRWWYPRLSSAKDEDSADVLEYEHEKCSETLRRAMLALLAFSLFSLLTVIGAPDASLINESASTIEIPFADVPITFSAFLVVAPLLLLVLLIYVHVFMGHLQRVELALGNQAVKRLPTLFTLDEGLPKILTGFIFYWLAPLVLAAITWKALARLQWGVPIAFMTVFVTATLAWLSIRRQRSPLRLYLNLLPWAAVIVSVATMGALAYGLTSGKGLDLLHRRLDLFRADLRGAWLVEVDLRGADLRFTNFEGATLTGSDMRKAKIKGANLKRAILRGVNFTDADLEGANLEDADLVFAKLVRANLKNSEMRGASLAGADAAWANLSWSGLKGVNLRKASLWNADMIGADFEGADLYETEFSGADLSGAKYLTQQQLSPACADKHGGGSSPTGRKTKFPRDLWPRQSCLALYYD